MSGFAPRHPFRPTRVFLVLLLNLSIALPFTGCGIKDAAKALFAAFVVTSTTHPVETKSYNAPVARFEWNLPNAVLYSRFLCRITSADGNTEYLAWQRCGELSGSMVRFDYQVPTDGSYLLLVQAVKSEGEPGDLVPFNFEGDFTKPTVPALGSTSHPAGTWKNTNDFTISWSSSDANPITYCVQLDSGTETCAAAASFSANDLSDGSHTFKVKARDEAGNESAHFTHSPIRVDVTPPVAPSFAAPTPADGAHLNAVTYTFKFTAGTDVTSGVLKHQCKLDSGSYADCNADTEITYGSLAAPLSEGAYTVSVKAIDNAENETIVTRAFTIDRTPPESFTLSATPHDPPEQWRQEDDVTVTFGTTDNLTPTGQIAYFCNIDFDPPAACTSPASFQDLDSGIHLVTVYAVDKAGNQTFPVQREVRVDKDAPEGGGLVEFLRVGDCTEGKAFWKGFQDEHSGVASQKLRVYDDAACTSQVAEFNLGEETSHTFTPPNGLDQRLYGRVSATDEVGNQAALTDCSEDFLYEANASYSGGGSGLMGDPFRIGNPLDLILLTRRACDWDARFYVTRPIPMSPGLPRYRPIGNDEVPFSGDFHGGHFLISGLVIRALHDSRYDDLHPMGMFGVVVGRVRHLDVQANVEAPPRPPAPGPGPGPAVLQPTGIVAGAVRGPGELYDVSVSRSNGDRSCALPSQVLGTDHLGGLVGDNSGRILIAGVECTDVRLASGNNAGGLVGRNAGTIQDAFTHADVDGMDGADTLGGLIGRNESTFAIERAYASASVSGSTALIIGGFIGWNDSTVSAVDSLYDLDRTPNEIGTGNGAGAVAKTSAQLQTPSEYPASYGPGTWRLPPPPPLPVPPNWPMAYLRALMTPP